MLLARRGPYKLSVSNHSETNPLMMARQLRREVWRRLIRGSPLIRIRYLKAFINSVAGSGAVQNTLLITEPTDEEVQVSIL